MNKRIALFQKLIKYYRERYGTITSRKCDVGILWTNSLEKHQEQTQFILAENTFDTRSRSVGVDGAQRLAS